VPPARKKKRPRKAGTGVDCATTIAWLEQWLHATDPFLAGYTGFGLVERHNSRATPVAVTIVPTGPMPPISAPPPSAPLPPISHVACGDTCRVCCVARILLRFYRHVAEVQSMPVYVAFTDSLAPMRKALALVVERGEAVRAVWRPGDMRYDRTTWTQSFAARAGIMKLAQEAIALSNAAAFLEPLVLALASSPDAGRGANVGRTPGLLLDETTLELRRAGFTPNEMATLIDDGAGGSLKARAQRMRVRLNKFSPATGRSRGKRRPSR